MGFLKRLFGVGVTAAATVAAVRVSDQYKQNNPNGVQDVNGDGTVDAKDVFEEVKKAAGEVYVATAQSVNEKAPVYAQQAKDTVNDVFGGKD